MEERASATVEARSLIKLDLRSSRTRSRPAILLLLELLRVPLVMSASLLYQPVERDDFIGQTEGYAFVSGEVMVVLRDFFDLFPGLAGVLRQDHVDLVPGRQQVVGNRLDGRCIASNGVTQQGLVQHQLAVGQKVTAVEAAGEQQGCHAVGGSQNHQPHGRRALLDDVVHQEARVDGTARAVDVHSDGIGFAKAVEVRCGQGELEGALLGDLTPDAEYATVAVDGVQRDKVDPAGGALDDVRHGWVLLSVKELRAIVFGLRYDSPSFPALRFWHAVSSVSARSRIQERMLVRSLLSGAVLSGLPLCSFQSPLSAGIRRTPCPSAGPMGYPGDKKTSDQITPVSFK